MRNMITAPYTVERFRMPSGLRIILLRRPGILRKFALWSVPFGSLTHTLPDCSTLTRQPAGILSQNASCCDLQIPSGVAHFLEHQLFHQEDGTSVSDAFAILGVQDNAYTSFDMTGYHFRCSGDIAPALRLLLQFTAQASFSKESVAIEQDIITQELLMYNEVPDVMLDLSLRQALFGECPIAEDIGGTPESIAMITPEILYACHRAFYRPQQAVLTVVGDIQMEEVVAIAEETQQNMRERTGVSGPTGCADEESSDAPLQYRSASGAVAQKSVVRKMSLPRPLYAMGFKEEYPTSDGKLILQRQIESDILIDLLFGRSGDNYWKLYRPGLIDNTFTAGYYSLGDAAFVRLSSECADPAELEKALQRLLHQDVASTITAAAVERLRRKSLGEYVVSYEDFEGIASGLAEAEHWKIPFDAIPELIQEVSVESLKRRYAEIFRGEQMCSAVVS